MDNEQGAAEWRDAWQRVWQVVDQHRDEADRTVPACPAWDVRELVAHMVGLVADVLDEDEPDDHNAAWTQRQVEMREGRSLDELRAEWERLEQPMVAWIHAHHTRPLGDVVIHEQDLREALGEPGGRGTAGLRALRDRMADGFGAAVADLPPIGLVAPTWRWASAGDPATAETVLEADELELTRALMSRRSAVALRSWTTRGDVTPYLDAFTALGPLPEDDRAG